MKISKCISILQTIKEKHGDLDLTVKYDQYGGCGYDPVLKVHYKHGRAWNGIKYECVEISCYE